VGIDARALHTFSHHITEEGPRVKKHAIYCPILNTKG